MSRLFSVIVPTLNERDHVLQLLPSIRNQTYRPVEIVIVDGKSTDGTNEIGAQFAEQTSGEDFTVMIVTAEVNVSKARNLGIQTSHGELVLLLDADFVLSDSRILQELSDALESDDMAHFQTTTIVDSWLEYQLMLDAEEPLFAHNTVAGWAFKRNLFERFQFDESLEFGEDRDLMIRISNSGVQSGKHIKSKGCRHFPDNLVQLRRQKLWYGRTSPLWILKHHTASELLVLSPLVAFSLFLLLFPAFYYSIGLGTLLTVVFLAFPFVLLLRSKARGVSRMAYLVFVRTIYGSAFFSLGFLYGLVRLLLPRAVDMLKDL